MTFSQRAVEAAARAIYENWANYPACDNSKPWEFICEERDAQADDFRRKGVAALTAALAVDGVALVPREPTEDMLDFGACYEDPDGLYQNHSIFKDGDISRDVYRAMVEAASREFPPPPAASEGEERK